MKLWGGRFRGPSAADFERFSESFETIATSSELPLACLNAGSTATCAMFPAPMRA